MRSRRVTVSLADIQALVAQFEKSDWRRIAFSADGVELMLSKDRADPAARPVATAASPVAASSAPAAPSPMPAPMPSGTVVTAASLGTFYRAPRPGQPPFVNLGDRVSIGDELCLVEVMKLFTSVRAPLAGVVTGFHAEDGALVEYGQALLSIDPDG